MPHRASLHKKLSLHRARIHLAHTEALVPLTLLGLLTGLLAGGLLIGFRELVILINDLLVPVGEEHFERLTPELRVLLPLTGACLLIGLIKLSPENRRQYGIAHVIERLTFNHGRLPATNVAGQFLGALIALTSGFSVGREGPAVHMGAGAGSILGQQLKLPDNTLTSLAGCGTAAAISASFNTPLAGVIFAMEVVIKEYTLGSFIPVMAASVSAAFLSQMMYGPEPAFLIPLIPMPSMEELIVSALAAFFIGALAAAFIRINLLASKLRGSRITLPLLVAGMLMGLTGFLLPEVMGIGYDTISLLLTGTEQSLSFILILLFAKLALTAIVIGLGVPGGVIGPSLMMGAMAGTALGIIGDNLLGLSIVDISFHALVGMVAMMAAVLQAPLAALVTVLEMTRNPNIIMPAMFAIVIACLTSSQLFRQRGLFDMQFKARGVHPELPLMTQQLNKTGVASLMETQFDTSTRFIALQQAKSFTKDWVLIADNHHATHAVPSSAIHTNFTARDTFDLLSIPSCRAVQSIHMQATLDDALSVMNQHSVDALSVLTIQKKGRKKNRVLCGIISREDIEDFMSSRHQPLQQGR